MGATFPILLELDENAPIKILKLLNQLPGIAKMHLDLNQFGAPKKARQQLVSEAVGGEQQALPAPRQQFAISGLEEAAAIVIAADSPIGTKDVRVPWMEKGRNVNSVHSGLTHAKEKGLIRSIGIGRGAKWEATAAGRKWFAAKFGATTTDAGAQEQLAFEQHAPEPHTNGHHAKEQHSAERKTATRIYGRTGCDIILEALRAHKRPMSVTELGPMFEKEGRSARSVDSQLYKLVKDKKVKAARAETGNTKLYSLQETTEGAR